VSKKGNLPFWKFEIQFEEIIKEKFQKARFESLFAKDDDETA